MGEIPREFHWKSWSHARPFFHRARILEEVVDVMHFLANILVAVGVTDDEFEQAYQAKQAINRTRQRDGYAASAGKERR